MCRLQIAKYAHGWTRFANVRVHATLKERPIDRFQTERASLTPLPLRYAGKRLNARVETINMQRVPMPVESLQHPLKIYAQFAAEVLV